MSIGFKLDGKLIKVRKSDGMKDIEKLCKDVFLKEVGKNNHIASEDMKLVNKSIDQFEYEVGKRKISLKFYSDSNSVSVAVETNGKPLNLTGVSIRAYSLMIIGSTQAFELPVYK